MSRTLTTSQVAQPQTLTIAEGTIDPQARVQAGQITDQKISELAERLLSDEFFDEIDPAALPTACVDGRGRADGSQELGANAAGGTFTLVMADALTTNSYRKDDQPAVEHAKRLYGQLLQLSRRIGGHDDDHATLPNCGCGAEDKLDSQAAEQPSILAYLERRADDIRAVVNSLGVEVSDEVHRTITEQAAQLRREGYATNGNDLRQAFVDTAGASSVEHLNGTHNEVIVIINTRPGSTLNRLALKAVFGEAYQAFNLDVAPLQAACELISLSADEARAKFAAALYYNVAVAAVLAGPSLRVVVR